MAENNKLLILNNINFYALEHMKNFVLIASFFLSICGSIYTMIFWGLFGLNGLSYINFSNIVSASLYPIVHGTILPLMIFFILLIIPFVNKIVNNDKNYNLINIINLAIENLSFRKQMIIACLALLLVSSYMAYILINLRAYSILSIVLILPSLFINLIFSVKFKYYFSSLKFSIFFLAIFIFLSCILNPYVESNKILDNKEYHYTLIFKENQLDTLKLIGNSDDRFVFINRTNETITFIKSDTLTLKFKIDSIWKKASHINDWARPPLPPLPPRG